MDQFEPRFKGGRGRPPANILIPLERHSARTLQTDGQTGQTDRQTDNGLIA